MTSLATEMSYQTPAPPLQKGTRCNQDTPLMYQTPRMLRKRTTDKSPPEHKRRRTDDVNTAYQEHRPTIHVYNHHKRKAEGAPSHQPAPKRHMSTGHWDEQHSPGTRGNLRPKRTHEDISEHVATNTPHKKIRRTQRLRTRPYPRPTNWVHDATQDGDTEPNPGPTAPTRVDQATQTTPPGDMGIEAHDAFSPPLRTTPLSQQPDDNIATKTRNADDSEQVQGPPHMLGPPRRYKPKLRPQAQVVPDLRQRPKTVEMPIVPQHAGTKGAPPTPG